MNWNKMVLFSRSDTKGRYSVSLVKVTMRLIYSAHSNAQPGSREGLSKSGAPLDFTSGSKASHDH